MKRVQKRLTSFILAVLLLLSGMCFENSRADASFSDALNAVTIADAEQVSVSPAVRVEENVAGQVMHAVKQIRRAGERSGFRTGADFSYVELLPRSLYFSEAAIAEPIENEVLSNTVILDFIHQKDGKKA